MTSVSQSRCGYWQKSLTPSFLLCRAVAMQISLQHEGVSTAVGLLKRQVWCRGGVQVAGKHARRVPRPLSAVGSPYPGSRANVMWHSNRLRKGSTRRRELLIQAFSQCKDACPPYLSVPRSPAWKTRWLAPRGFHP